MCLLSMVAGMMFSSCWGQDFAKSLVAVAVSVSFPSGLQRPTSVSEKSRNEVRGLFGSSFGQVSWVV